MTEEELSQVVVGYDDSESAQRALEWAGRLAQASGAELHVVNVVSSAGEWLASVAQVDPDALRREREELINGPWTAPLAARGVSFRASVKVGSPAKELMDVAAAENADLIVVGASGHGMAGDLLLGSVSHNLLHHARRPVVVVP